MTDAKLNISDHARLGEGGIVPKSKFRLLVCPIPMFI